MRDKTSVSGGWLGTFRYAAVDAARRPVRFAATLRAVGPDGDQIDGEMVDNLTSGIARLDGSRSGAIVRFSKQNGKANRVDPAGRIDYAGIMSDDGTVMRGTWRSRTEVHGIAVIGGQGSWDARRRSEEPVSADGNADSTFDECDRAAAVVRR
jgi:hypothetical protein